jgi:hypothetical protein
LDSHFSFVGFVGGASDGQKAWGFSIINLSGKLLTAPIRPGVGFGIGLEYGPIVRLQGALLIPSIEVSYGQERAELNFERGTIEAGIQRLPILLWVKIISESNLSPFLRLGAGIAKTDYREVGYHDRGPNIRFHEWHFAWAFGTGLNYQLSRTIAGEFFFEDWISEQNIVGLNSIGYEDGLYGRFGILALGLRAIVSL